MRKWGKSSKTSLAAVMAASMLGLSACGGGSSTGTTSGTDSGSDSGGADSAISGEITYGYWDDNQKEALEQNIEDFNKIYPDVKVVLNQTPWGQYWTKLQTQAESKTLPDVFWMNGPNLALYGSNGMLEPIDAIVESGAVDLSNYPDSLNELYSIDSVQYAVPKDYDTIAMWYNKALFEKAGVELPTAEWTWEDFTKAANDISAALKDEGVYGAGVQLSGQESYYNTIAQAGGYVISPDKKQSGFDTPEGIEGLEFWTDLIASGASPTPEQLSDTSASDRFASGKVAMTWDGNWGITKYSESDFSADIDVIDLPRGKEQASVIHGLGYAVSAFSQNKDAAQAFQAYLGSLEAATAQATLGGVIPAYIGTQETFVNSVPEWNLRVFVEAADDYSVPYPTSLNGQAWAELEAQLLPPAFSGTVPVPEVAKNLADQMNAILATE